VANPRALAKKRLFFALWPEDDIRAALEVSAGRAVQGAVAGVIPPANLHMTLAFLGSVTVTTLPDLVTAAAAVRFLPFNIDLERTGYWPRSQVAWLAPAACPPALQALVDDLWIKMAGLGFYRDDRPYLPHVTLGRKVDSGAVLQLEPALRWPVASFALVESVTQVAQVTQAAGPVYTVLEQFSAGD
jgi:2'-5' RNA ligase